MRILILFILLVGCSQPLLKKKSFLNLSGHSPVIDEVMKLINLNDYELKTMTIAETSFHMFGKRKNGISIEELEKSLLKVWPKISITFDTHPEEVAIVVMEGAIGSKRISSKILSILEQKKIPEEEQNRINNNLNWKPKNSTSAYIKSQYSSFKYSKRAYIDDALLLELGNLLFIQTQHLQGTNWFQSGLSLIYGNQTWRSFHRQNQPILDAEVSQYIRNQSQILGMTRAKAYLFLNACRKTIGETNFDEYINNMINEKVNPFDYDSFLDILKSEEKEKIQQVSELFKVSNE